jgi:hypothetical protein
VAVRHGDLVAIQRGGLLQVHRVVRLRPGVVITMGDNTGRADPAVAPPDVLGVVVRQRTREGLVLSHRAAWMRAVDRAAAWLSPATRVPWRLAALLARVRRRLLPARRPWTPGPGPILRDPDPPA